MSGSGALERGYSRWLWCYPKWYRREYEAEILGVLLTGAGADRSRPDARECLALLTSGLRIRLGPARTDRSIRDVVKLMYVGAALELAVGITVFATMNDVIANVAADNPGSDQSQWRPQLTSSLHGLVVSATIATAFWLFMAWANGRRFRWARIAFALFAALTTYSLLTGLLHGSAVYARSDLAAGVLMWLVQVRVLVQLCRGRRHRPTLAAA
jgi:hypothetical protein